MFTCIGAEIGSIMLFINAKWTLVQGNMIWLAVVVFWTLVLSFKMFVNVFQWIGGLQRFIEHNHELEGADFFKYKPKVN